MKEMGTVVLACQTIKDELNLAVKETGVSHPIFFVESGLHNFPDSLRRRIQEEINRIDNVDTILMGFGYCGNSLIGIKSHRAGLVIPRVDDCISLLLGSYDLRKNISREMGTYFLTKGWLEYESNLLTEYERCVRRYGSEKALRIMKIMLQNYGRLVTIDTGAYPVEDFVSRTRDFADRLGMKHEIVGGSLRFLIKLLRGPWDEEFIIIEPGREVTFEDMRICGAGDKKPEQILFGFTM